MELQDIFKHIARPNNEGCMLWMRGKNNTEYGYAYINGRHKRVHRLVWEHYNGAIPNGMLVCHKYDNPPCCNLEHLFLGTHKDNHHDKVLKGRQHRGEELVWSVLTAEQVIEMRRLYKDGRGTTSLCNKYGVGLDCVRKALLGLSWSHIPGAISQMRRAKLPTGKVRQIRSMFKDGWSTSKIAEKLNLNYATVYCIATGRRRSDTQIERRRQWE